MKKYKLYLFDFDGTLLDTLGSLEYVFTVSYESIGVKFDPNDTVEFSRVPLTYGYKKYGADPNKWEQFVKIIDESLDHEESMRRTKFYPESREFINYLYQNNIKCGIVTSNNSNHVKEVLRILDLPIDAFEIYIGNKECTRFKPHPDPILKALDESRFDGELDEVAYIGDGPNDMISANAAGVDAILIDRQNLLPSSDKYKKISNLMELFK